MNQKTIMYLLCLGSIILTGCLSTHTPLQFNPTQYTKKEFEKIYTTTLSHLQKTDNNIPSTHSIDINEFITYIKHLHGFRIPSTPTLRSSQSALGVYANKSDTFDTIGYYDNFSNQIYVNKNLEPKRKNQVFLHEVSHYIDNKTQMIHIVSQNFSDYFSHSPDIPHVTYQTFTEHSAYKYPYQFLYHHSTLYKTNYLQDIPPIIPAFITYMTFFTDYGQDRYKISDYVTKEETHNWLRPSQKFIFTTIKNILLMDGYYHKLHPDNYHKALQESWKDLSKMNYTQYKTFISKLHNTYSSKELIQEASSLYNKMYHDIVHYQKNHIQMIIDYTKENGFYTNTQHPEYSLFIKNHTIKYHDLPPEGLDAHDALIISHKTLNYSAFIYDKGCNGLGNSGEDIFIDSSIFGGSPGPDYYKDLYYFIIHNDSKQE